MIGSMPSHELPSAPRPVLPLMNQDDARWMAAALELARDAAQAGEVPIGAVVVQDGEVIGRGANRPIGSCDPTAHAEIVALRDAAARIGNYRLTGATLYVTLEPCLMCLGAMVHARIGRLVFGAADPKVSTTQRLEQLAADAVFNHRFQVEGGVEAEAAAQLLKRFFGKKREEDRRQYGEVPKWS